MENVNDHGPVQLPMFYCSLSSFCEDFVQTLRVVYFCFSCPWHEERSPRHTKVSISPSILSSLHVPEISAACLPMQESGSVLELYTVQDVLKNTSRNIIIKTTQKEAIVPKYKKYWECFWISAKRSKNLTVETLC